MAGREDDGSEGCGAGAARNVRETGGARARSATTPLSKQRSCCCVCRQSRHERVATATAAIVHENVDGGAKRSSLWHPRYDGSFEPQSWGKSRPARGDILPLRGAQGADTVHTTDRFLVDGTTVTCAPEQESAQHKTSFLPTPTTRDLPSAQRVRLFLRRRAYRCASSSDNRATLLFANDDC